MNAFPLPVSLPLTPALPTTMEHGDVRAYAALGFLQAQARTSDLSAAHQQAYCALRSRGAAIDGIYAFWPLSRRAMRKIFAQDQHESTSESIARVQRPAAHLVHQRIPDPETLLALKQRAQALSAALDALSHHDRALVQHVYGIDLGQSDAHLKAVVEGVHRSTVSRRHQAVLSRLRSIIGRSSTTKTKEMKRGPVTSAK